MAGGWARDGAVQEQIDASVEDGVARAKGSIPQGESAEYCEVCDEPISQARREAIPGVQMCIECQTEQEKKTKSVSSVNRRASKDSLLR